MSVDDLTDSQLALIDPEFTSGRALGEYGKTSAALKRFPFGADGLFLTYLQWKRTNYNQIAGACAVSAVESHPANTVFRVQQTRVTHRRKWYSVNEFPPYDSTLILDLSWPVTTSTTPGGFYSTRGAGGSTISPPSCTATSDAADTKPARWDDGPSGSPPADHHYSYVDEASTAEDQVVLSMSAANSYAAANEIILSTLNWATVKTFSRRTFDGKTLAFSTGGGSVLVGGAGSRTKYEFRVRGRKLPFRIKWQERTYSALPGVTPPAWNDGEHLFSHDTGWTWTWDVPYPASQMRFELSGFRVVPV